MLAPLKNVPFVGWVNRGAITDRRREHLGRSDRGIIMVRQRFFNDLKTIAAGGEPKAIVRDPDMNRCITLPIIGRQQFIDGLPRDEAEASCREFPFLVGEPEEVRRDYAEAMGFET